MPILKVTIEISSETWDKLPIVARFLALPSDAQTPKVLGWIVETLLNQAEFEARAEAIPKPPPKEAQKVLTELLDPNVGKPVVVQALQNVVAQETGKTLFELFEDYTEELTGDPWIEAIKARAEDADYTLWGTALAATYQVIQGEERKTRETWALIERTYQLLKKTP